MFIVIYVQNNRDELKVLPRGAVVTRPSVAPVDRRKIRALIVI